MSRFENPTDFSELTDSSGELAGIKDGSSWTLPGPYTNQAGAVAAGVGDRQAYYDNGGTVRVVIL
jgi:hypothetical protein